MRFDFASGVCDCHGPWLHQTALLHQWHVFKSCVKFCFQRTLMLFTNVPKAAQMAFAIRHTTGIVCVVADKAASHSNMFPFSEFKQVDIVVCLTVCTTELRSVLLGRTGWSTLVCIQSGTLVNTLEC